MKLFCFGKRKQTQPTTVAEAIITQKLHLEPLSACLHITAMDLLWRRIELLTSLKERPVHPDRIRECQRQLPVFVWRFALLEGVALGGWRNPWGWKRYRVAPLLAALKESMDSWLNDKLGTVPVTFEWQEMEQKLTRRLTIESLLTLAPWLNKQQQSTWQSAPLSMLTHPTGLRSKTTSAALMFVLRYMFVHFLNSSSEKSDQNILSVMVSAAQRAVSTTLAWLVHDDEEGEEMNESLPCHALVAIPFQGNVYLVWIGDGLVVRCLGWQTDKTLAQKQLHTSRLVAPMQKQNLPSSVHRTKSNASSRSHTTNSSLASRTVTAIPVSHLSTKRTVSTHSVTSTPVTMTKTSLPNVSQFLVTSCGPAVSYSQIPLHSLKRRTCSVSLSQTAFILTTRQVDDSLSDAERLQAVTSGRCAGERLTAAFPLHDCLILEDLS